VRPREVVALALALPVGWVLPRLLGLAPQAPLAATVATVPLVVAGLLAVEGVVARRGGRRAPTAETAAFGALVLGWLVFVAARPRLGVPIPAAAVATTLFAIFGGYLLRLLPRLRPLLGAAAPRRPPALFFWVPLLAYLAILPWSTGQRAPDGDEPYYLLVAHSLAWDGDADLTDNYERGDSLRFMPRRLEPQPGDPVGPAGERYSRHNLLLPLVLAPAYRLAGARGAFLVMAAMAAALAWMTLRVAGRRYPDQPGGALLAWALLAFAPPLLLYSHQVWVEVPAALLVMVALDAAAGGPAERPGWRRTALLWGALLLLPLLKLRFALFAIPLALLAWWRGGRRPGPLVAAGVAGAVVAGILWFNHARFGSALKTYDFATLFTPEPLLVVLARALGLFVDAGFGLFPAAPLWALLVPALAWLLVRRDPLLLDLALLVLPYVVLLAWRREWYGGWSPPFRYGVAVLPLLALALVPLLASRRRGGARLLVAGLGAATAGLTLLWLAMPGWTYNLADGGTHLTDHLGRGLQLDVQRLFPSGVRPRAATWWWTAAMPLLVLLWWRPRRLHPAFSAAGVALALALPAAAVALAARLPTRVVEPEDPQVVASGGGLFPGPWTFDRLRFDGGWALREGAWVEAPVVTGGERATLRVRFRLLAAGRRAALLEVKAGDQSLGRWRTPRDPDWHFVEVGPVDWPAGAPLVVAVHRLREQRGGRAVVLVDRVEVQWQ
jgi:hypothetical protein